MTHVIFETSREQDLGIKVRAQKIIRRAMDYFAMTQNREGSPLVLKVIAQLYTNPRKSVPIQEDNSINTMATDGSRIFYNSHFLIALQEEAILAACSRAFKEPRNDNKSRGLDIAVLSELETLKRHLPEGVSIRYANSFINEVIRSVEGFETVYLGGRAPILSTQDMAIKAARDSGLDPVGDIDQIRAMYAAIKNILYPKPSREKLLSPLKEEADRILQQWVSSVLIHEMLHIFQGDVGKEGTYGERLLVTRSGGNGEDYASRKLHSYVNIAADAVINDIIETEIFKFKNSPGTILPLAAVSIPGSRSRSVESIYFETVKNVCSKLHEKLGRTDPFKEPETILEAERAFRRCIAEMKEKTDGQQEQGAGKDGTSITDGSGALSAEDAAREIEEELKNRSGESGNGEGRSGEGGIGEGGSGKGGGKAGKSSSPTGGDKGGASAGSTESKLDEILDEAEGEVFKGKGKALDDHDDHERMRGRSRERGLDPKEQEEIFGRIASEAAKEILESPEGHAGMEGIGSGSALANILLRLVERYREVDCAFLREIKDVMKSVFGPTYKEDVRKFDRKVHAINPGLIPHGKSAFIPARKRGNKCGKLLVGIDVSGSMSDKDVKEAVMDTLSIMESIGKGHIIGIAQMDGGVVSYEEYEAKSQKFKRALDEWKEKGFSRHGMGGTSYMEFFSRIKEAEKSPARNKRNYRVKEDVDQIMSPDAVLVFTDEGFDAKELVPVEPEAPVYFISTGDRYMSEIPFGKGISCKDLVKSKERWADDGPSR